MCMKATEEGCVLSAQQKELTNRVDKLEKQMVELQTVQRQTRSELQAGFTDLKNQMEHIYQERAEWSKWMRENLPKVGKWLGKWSLILIGVAIGVNNIPTIIKLWSAAPK